MCGECVASLDMIHVGVLIEVGYIRRIGAAADATCLARIFQFEVEGGRCLRALEPYAEGRELSVARRRVCGVVFAEVEEIDLADGSVRKLGLEGQSAKACFFGCLVERDLVVEGRRNVRWLAVDRRGVEAGNFHALRDCPYGA